MKAETDVCVCFTKLITPVLRTFVSFSTRQSILIRRKLFACLYEFFKRHCLVCLAHFSVLATKYKCFVCFFNFYCTKRYLKFCFVVNPSFSFELCEWSAFFSCNLISTVTVRRRARRNTLQTSSSCSFSEKKNRKK